MRILAVAGIGAVHHISPENIVRSSDGLIIGEIWNARVGLNPVFKRLGNRVIGTYPFVWQPLPPLAGADPGYSAPIRSCLCLLYLSKEL
jgi:hypothetical protein